MPVKYHLKQINRTFKDGRKDSANGKWFARTVTVGTVETNDLAEIIQRNCSLKKSDVQAVLTELVEVMTDKLQDSYAVKINGLGTFKIAVKSDGALEASDFSVSNNITGARINFRPSYTVDVASGNQTKALLNGCKFSETAKNSVGVVID